MDKSSRTLLLLLVASSIVLIICIDIYKLYNIWLYSSSHPLLVLNLIILLIIASSRCLAISRHINHTDDRERIIPLNSSPQERIAEEHMSKPTKQKTLESKWKTTKEGSQLRQLKHSHTTVEDSVITKEGSQLRQLKHSNSTVEDNVKPPEMLPDRRIDEVTSSAPSSLSSAKLRKNVSLSKEEVNRRVERFIRKFNDD